MKLPRVIGPGAVAFLALWVLFLAAGRSSFFRDPGTFWHTVVGDRILAHGFFDTDPYTFTFHGAKWIPHQWLGEVTMAGAHRVAGFDSLLLLTATALAALFAWLAVRLLNTGLNPVVVGAVVLLAVAAGASHFHVRPHLATIVGMAVTAAFVTDFDAGRIGLRRMLWLVPVYAVWANCHGGVLGGMLTMLLVWAGWILQSPGGAPPGHFASRIKTLGLVALVGVACALPAVLNPYGRDLLNTWLGIMDSPVLPQIIKEHARLDFRELAAWPVLAFAAVYVFVLAGVPWARQRVVYWLPLFWLAQAYLRVRHAPLFAVTGLVGVAAMWPHTHWAAWLATHRPDFQEPLDRPAPRRIWANVWLPVACVLAAAGVQWAGVSVPLVGKGWVQLDPKTWPVEMLDTLREHEPKAGQPPAKLFNEYTDGGYVIYHAPGYRVFVDDRCELFGDAWLLKFVTAERARTARTVGEWEARYGAFDFALTRTGSGFDRHFAAAAGWVRVRRTETAAFYRFAPTEAPAPRPVQYGTD